MGPLRPGERGPGSASHRLRQTVVDTLGYTIRLQTDGTLAIPRNLMKPVEGLTLGPRFDACRLLLGPDRFRPDRQCGQGPLHLAVLSPFLCHYVRLMSGRGVHASISRFCADGSLFCAA